ncbi:MAG: HAMP domain-containing histidine kinase [Planctomycetales bacterium]|nr:HAMP domain-containing histidine kinase [Planctomycetales bacterium]
MSDAPPTPAFLSRFGPLPPLTWRLRLMLWNALVVLAAGGVTLAVLREGVRYTLLHEADQLLHEDIRELQLMLADAPVDYDDMHDALDQRAQGHRQHGWFVEFLDQRDKPIWSSDNAPDHVAGGSVAVNDLVPYTAGSLRVLEHRLARRQADIFGVRVGTSLEPIWKDLARIDRQVLLAGAVVFLAAPACGYWLAGRATQPLSAMTHTAARLRPSRLDERLEDRGTGDELDQLARTINGLLDRIAVHLERKQDLLANAAHELRTPLAAIRSSIEVALNEQRSTDDYIDLLGEIIEESGHLSSLVNQLLLLSEAEADRPLDGFTCVELDRIVRGSVDMFQGVAESLGVQLHADLQPLAVRGRADYLKQVVNNLLDNAIKFTPAEGKVSVALRPAAEKGFVEFSVADTGIGIDAADQQRVFERFYHRPATVHEQQQRQGTGLGLSICRAVVQAHGGRIRLASQPRAGTTFIVELPVFEALA